MATQPPLKKASASPGTKPAAAGKAPAPKPKANKPDPANDETIAPAILDEATDQIDATQPLMEANTMNLDPASIPTEADAEKKVEADDGEKMVSVLGEFKLLKKLGQGGMGAVYKAQQASTGKAVAIKVLAKALVKKKEFVERFKREARAMEKLDHPNVLTCLGFGEDKGYHYIAMDFIEGGSVEGQLKKLGRFEIGDAMHIILKTASALQHAHEKSLIHRDIKPDNLLLTKDGILKVADLGLAKDTEEDVSLTKSGAGAGTPIYMAPEQAYNVKHVDCRVDIYALGVMVYVFLTGQPPFQGTTPIELIMAKEKGKFDPIRKHNDEVPGKLDLIVDKMLAKDPKHRYATCAEVINELEPLGLANEQLSWLEKPKAKPTAAAKAPGKSASKPAAGATKAAAAGKTTASPAETVEKDVWYWNMVTQSGKIVSKKVSTEQLRTLVKAGHLDAEAQLCKTLKGSYRSAATFPEFMGVFKARETATAANAKGQNYRQQMKEIAAADARKRRWGWLTKKLKGVGGTIFGLLWIAAVLAILGGGGWYVYTNYLR